MASRSRVAGSSFVTVTAAKSPYVTSGEEKILCLTSTGAITITLASKDRGLPFERKVIDADENAGTNSITVQTEGSEKIDPGANDSVTITTDGARREFYPKDPSADDPDWWTDTDSQYQSINADQLNNDEEPNLDISEALWPVFTQSLSFRTRFESEDGFSKTSSGSGSTALTTGEYQVFTGTTDESHQRVRHPFSNSGVSWTWDNDRRIKFSINFVDADGPLTAVTGFVSEGTYTTEHMGFQMDTDGSLKATVADGTTQNKSVLDSTPTTGSAIDLYAELVARTEARFWLDKSPPANSPDVTLSSNIPTGSNNGIQVWTLLAENNTATQRQIHISEIIGGRAP